VLVLLVGGVQTIVWGLDALTKLAGQILVRRDHGAATGMQLLYRAAGHGAKVVARPRPPARRSRCSFVVITINAVNFVDGLDGLVRGRRSAIASQRLLRLHLRAVGGSISSTNAPTAPTLLTAVLAGACIGLPAAQLQPGPDLHGGLRLDVARAGARGRHSMTLTGQVELRTR
jgi:UDP-GlcNAc:undecaprenyl-phosphate GlcNAc-1-phosphate transferase